MRARHARNRSTSKAGADHVTPTLGLRCRAVLAVIVTKQGATIAEIKRELGIDANQVSGRIANLRDDFTPPLIEDSGAKRAIVSPVPGIVWKATQAGENALNGRSDVLQVHASKVVRPAETVPQLSLDLLRT